MRPKSWVVSWVAAWVAAWVVDAEHAREVAEYVEGHGRVPETLEDESEAERIARIGFEALEEREGGS